MTTDRTATMLGAELDGLRAAVPNLVGVLVASADGRPLAGDVPGRDAKATAAMSAALLGLGQRVGQELGSAPLEEATVRTGDGLVAVFSAGRAAAVVALAPTGVNLGLLNHFGRAAARVVSVVLAELDTRRSVNPSRRLLATPQAAPAAPNVSPPPAPDLNPAPQEPIGRAQGPESGPVATGIEVGP